MDTTDRDINNLIKAAQNLLSLAINKLEETNRYLGTEEYDLLVDATCTLDLAKRKIRQGKKGQ